MFQNGIRAFLCHNLSLCGSIFLLMKSLANAIYSCFKDKGEFSLKDAYSENSDKPRETVRARIYDNLGVKFERVAKGLYKTIEGDESCVVIEGDGRDLSMLGDASIDCILTDHPWLDKKSNKGGDRNFATYDCFRYTLDDFKEKARVLKDGCFLVEILPAENENNYDYLYQIKKYAEQCGLLYYSKVTWKKGNFVSNTGRKSKNTQDVMIFSKGKARSLRIDAKKTKDTGTPQYMSGTTQMLPAMFDIPPVARKNKIHQSELPLTLCEKILQFVTRQGETVLDTFVGSGVVGEAALNLKRNCILIELAHRNILKDSFLEPSGQRESMGHGQSRVSALAQETHWCRQPRASSYSWMVSPMGLEGWQGGSGRCPKVPRNGHGSQTQCVGLVIYGAGPLFLASGHPPRPYSHRWVQGGCGVCLHGQGLGRRCLVSCSPPVLCGGQRLPHSGPYPHPAPGPDMEVHQPTRLAPGPFPLGVFSKPATFLRGFTRDPPHPQLGGSHCLLPPPPSKATPYVLCF